jgi:tetratricopeptide (TPR) repeat protein
MRSRWLPTLALPLMLCTLAPPALADDPVTQARQRFAAGRSAYGEGRYKDAVELFLQANALDPHAELLFNVGQAYEKLDDVSHALRVFREYLRLLPNAADRALVEEKDRKLEARLRERRVQQVTVLSRPSGATVVLDGKAVGQTPWTGDIEPGHHVAVIKSEGYADGTGDFTLAPEHAMDVEVPLARPPSSGPQSPEPPGPIGPGVTPPTPPGPGPDVPPEVPPTPAPRGRHVAPWTIAALSVGVAGLGAALGLELARQGAENTAKNDPTQTGYQSALSQMTTFQTASRVLVGVGAVATAAGGVLLVLDLRGGGDAPPKATVGCFAGACGAFATGRF